MIEVLAALGSIILVDLVLSGDNALVIGAAAAGLPRRQRWYAIVLGGGGAIVLRIAFAILATLLLRLAIVAGVRRAAAAVYRGAPADESQRSEASGSC